MSGHEQRGLPASWTENHQGAFCLACRRELAAEAAVSGTSWDLSIRERARLRSFAVIEFEVRRDPHRSNAKIANAVHTSVVAVQKARQRLGAHADENDTNGPRIAGAEPMQRDEERDADHRGIENHA